MTLTTTLPVRASPPMMEEDRKALPLKDGAVKPNSNPFEIVTVKFAFCNVWEGRSVTRPFTAHHRDRPANHDAIAHSDHRHAGKTSRATAIAIDQQTARATTGRLSWIGPEPFGQGRLGRSGVLFSSHHGWSVLDVVVISSLRGNRASWCAPFRCSGREERGRTFSRT